MDASAAAIESRSLEYALSVRRAPASRGEHGRADDPDEQREHDETPPSLPEFLRDEEPHGVRPGAHAINLRASEQGRQGAIPIPAEVLAPGRDIQVRGSGTGKCLLPGHTVMSFMRPSSATSQKSVPGPSVPSGIFHTKL